MVKYTLDFKTNCLSKSTLNQIVKAVVPTELAGVTSCYPTISALLQIIPCICPVKHQVQERPVTTEGVQGKAGKLVDP